MCAESRGTEGKALCPSAAKVRLKEVKTPRFNLNTDGGSPFNSLRNQSHCISHQTAFCDMKWETAARKKRLRPCLLEVAQSRVNDFQKAEINGVRENVLQTEAPLKAVLKSVR